MNITVIALHCQIWQRGRSQVGDLHHVGIGGIGDMGHRAVKTAWCV